MAPITRSQTGAARARRKKSNIPLLHAHRSPKPIVSQSPRAREPTCRRPRRSRGLTSAAQKCPAKRKLEEFHLFSRLPVELQFMIWDFHSINEPVTRHYFLMDDEGRRGYAAFNTAQRKFVKHPLMGAAANTGLTDAPLPNEDSIFVADSIHVIELPYKLDARPNMLTMAPLRPERLDESQGYSWVNFKRDIFIFDRSRYWILQQGSEFKFLASDDERCSWMSDDSIMIPENHWARKIRHLGLYVDSNFVNQSHHAEVLTQMTKLEKISLIHVPWGNPGPFCRLLTKYAKQSHSGGLVNADLFVRQHVFERFSWCPCTEQRSSMLLRPSRQQGGLARLEPDLSAYQSLRERLEGLLKEQGRSDVEVEVVVDVLGGSWARTRGRKHGGRT